MQLVLSVFQIFFDLKEARTIKEHNIPLLVLNTESGIFSTGITKKLAEYAGALYTEIR